MNRWSHLSLTRRGTAHDDAERIEQLLGELDGTTGRTFAMIAPPGSWPSSMACGRLN
jgi:hypothetical protein